jgi:hypothetical protein
MVTGTVPGMARQTFFWTFQEPMASRSAIFSKIRATRSGPISFAVPTAFAS